MTEEEIKLTTSNNATSNGQEFPSTPKPQVLTEHFASIEESKKEKTNDSQD